MQGSQPCRGFGARSPDRGLGWEPQAGFRAAALTEGRGREPRPGFGAGAPSRYQGGSPDRGPGREPRRQSVSTTTRFPQLTLRGVSAVGANGAEGVGSPALLGSQPISVGWVQRRTKLRTQCNHRLDTSTGARRRRSAGFSPGSGASRHLAFSQSITSLYFAVQKKRYGECRTHKVQGSQPCRGFGARSPDRGLGWNPKRLSVRQP